LKSKTKPLIFSLFFVLILVSGLVLTAKVNADSFYNWLQNSSFIAYSNYIEYGSFENAQWEEGEIYGNWSQYEEKCYFNV